MRKFSILLVLIILGQNLMCQTIGSNNYQNEFQQAYLQFPSIPKGILEGVSYAQTRITHISGNNEGCIGLPQVSGLMGLTENGQGYFKDNLIYCSQVSGISIQEIKSSPLQNIVAYASAYNHLLLEFSSETFDFKTHAQILKVLSEIPMDKNKANQFALDCFVYEVFKFLNEPVFQLQYDFPNYSLDFVEIFGVENYRVLSSTNVTINSNQIQNSEGVNYEVQQKSLEYGPALWVATPTCNYSSRSGTAISAVTIHTIQGSYAGAISWAQNCSANVSYHYVARSSDGQITQMVYEADKAWHVGSENPYTIGIEHEGYVTNPAWYTEAMYVGSANLVKDICNSGYGINPLRTFQGPATSGSNVLGGCTKIKGHQHYPNQSHTDPGINWNWEHYYQLINNTTPITSYTTSTGTIYDSGGASGNYSNDERYLYLISPAGVSTVTISFQSFSIENNWDYLYVYDGNTTSSTLLGVFTGTTLPSNITSTGPQILIEFRSDCSTVSSGYQINWTSAIGGGLDVVPPVTSITTISNWVTTNFTANFTDSDNVGGSGILYKTYQVIDYNGIEWRANANHGFFSDNFDLAIHPDWTTIQGNWSVVTGYLNQNDEANGNTNIYASLNQDDYNLYLYQYGMKISGSGTNKRVGFHFMCDDPTLTNRGNSYFIWFRDDDNKVQIYKVVNDVFTLESEVSYSINTNQWYDVKCTYDKNSGLIKVWLNDVFVLQWTDSSPYTTGNSVSFRSGNSLYDVNDFKVYHNRSNSALISIGTNEDIQFENTNSFTPSAKLKSIVIDSSNNVSAIASQLLNVDWTIPSTVTNLNDGLGADIDVTTNNTSLSANWNQSLDSNSSIARYWYSIGTAAGLTDVVNWVDNWFDTSFTHTGLTLSYGTTYFVNVKSENGAGLQSSIISSDGQLLNLPFNPPIAGFNVSTTYLCAGDSIQLINTSTDATDYSWSVIGATPSSSILANPYFNFPVSGAYDIILTADGPGGTDVMTQTITIEVLNPPVADFSVSATTLNIDYAFLALTNNSTNANGYYWDFGDGSSATDTDPWHEFNAVGTYQIMLIAINGACENDTAYVSIEVINTNGLADVAESSVSIFPNPTSGNFVLSFSNWQAQNINLSLVNGLGQVVYADFINSVDNTVTINLTDKHLADGIYVLNIWDSNMLNSVLIEIKN